MACCCSGNLCGLPNHLLLMRSQTSGPSSQPAPYLFIGEMLCFSLLSLILLIWTQSLVLTMYMFYLLLLHNKPLFSVLWYFIINVLVWQESHFLKIHKIDFQTTEWMYQLFYNQSPGHKFYFIFDPTQYFLFCFIKSPGGLFSLTCNLFRFYR